MQLFKQFTKINLFHDIQSFATTVKIDDKDFILATKSVFEKHLRVLNLPAHIIFRSDYGHSEPTDIMTDALIEDFRKTDCKRIIAIGGGSVIDMAKVLMLKSEGNTEDIFLRRVPIIKEHQLIAVPTTCGAGSEVSSVSIVSLTRKSTKVGLADDAITPDYAALIPDLLTDMPYNIFVTSAIDALIHAIESFVCPKANRYTDLFSEEATRTIVKGFSSIRAEGKEARYRLFEDFLIASNMAGIAFANSGTGAVHAMSYPLSTKYGVTHGEACYQMFTAVFQEYQRQKPKGKIQRIILLLADILNCEAAEVFFKLEELLQNIIPRQPLREYGMKEEEIEEFADNVIELQERLLSQSYVRFSRETMCRIYRALF